MPALVEQVGRLVRSDLFQDGRQVLLQLVGAVEGTILPAQLLQAPVLPGLQPRGVFQQAEARPLERLGRLRLSRLCGATPRTQEATFSSTV